MTPDVDVVIVGGGPVGLAASVYARRAGLTVTVVEPRHAPIDKACGEGLMPTGLAALRALGVDPPGREFVGITYLTADGRQRADASFRGAAGRGVRRTELHRALSERAAAIGVAVRTAKVTAVDQDTDGVEAQLTTGERVGARYLLAADGLHSPIRRAVGLRDVARGPVRYGLRTHFAVVPWSDRVEVYWGRTAEAYVTPVDDDVVGVAVLGIGRAGSFPERLRQFPALVARLHGRAAMEKVAGAGPLRQRVTAVGDGRVMLVGDAAGYVDALTGEGLSIGFDSARIAVDCIVRECPEQYGRRWRAASRRSRLLTEAVVAAAGSRWFRPAIVPAADLVPEVFSLAVRSLA